MYSETFLTLIGICLLVVQLSAAIPFNGRVYGGELAEPGQFPYIVSIQEDYAAENHSGHYCGGSILNKQWIVTAGHCVWAPDLENYEIIAGTNLLDTGGSRYNVTKLIQHPEFNLSIIANDIALIKIDGEFEFSDTITSIPIGEVSGNVSSIAAGWGATKEVYSPNELRFLEVTALYQDDCTRLAQGSTYYDDFPPGPAQVCILSSEGKGVCSGDSGSPLVYNNTLIGVASYILETSCATKYPDVYTRTTFHKEWIEETIKNNTE